jgi:hypothetical protein
MKVPKIYYFWYILGGGGVMRLPSKKCNDLIKLNYFCKVLSGQKIKFYQLVSTFQALNFHGTTFYIKGVVPNKQTNQHVLS